ncbi:MAG: hypothetical protein KIT84_43685 [Labilithrix sp.]|nr:hypothetical protein [Labilithrix sp.]MCW5817982.1 hypothetical protein [Labilithrix sp.]
MPVVVAVIGIGDTPEEQCETWRDVVGARAFVLCPRGAKHYVLESDDAGALAPIAKQSPPVASGGDSDGTTEPTPTPTPTPTPPAPKPRQLGYFFADEKVLEREVNAGLAALKQRFPSYVAEQSLVYAGFSRGAFLGPKIVTKQPAKYPRAIFIEGGQSAWTPESAAAFAKGGGKRVLFACGQPSCVEEVAPAAALLRAQRVEIKVVHGAGEGHGYKRQVKQELKKSLSWVVEDDPAWPD